MQALMACRQAEELLQHAPSAPGAPSALRRVIEAVRDYRQDGPTREDADEVERLWKAEFAFPEEPSVPGAPSAPEDSI